MTARQPPREKGANACTIGNILSRDGNFCTLFPGEQWKKSKIMQIKECFLWKNGQLVSRKRTWKS